MPVSPRLAKAIARAATANGLTLKQTKYAAYLAAGSNKSTAYKAVYDCSETANSPVGPEATRLFQNPKVASTIEHGMATVNLLTASEGLRTRELIANGLAEGLEDLAKAKDWQAFAKVAKVTGEQVHVQAFAKKRDADDAKQLTDFLSELSGLRNDLIEAGFAKPVIDITPAIEAQPEEPTQENQQLA